MEIESQINNCDVEELQTALNTDEISTEIKTESLDCEHCEKSYKTKSSLKRHISTIHEKNKVRKLKLENDNLELKIKLYSGQIKFLKRLVIIQDHTLLRERVHLQVKPNTIINNPNPITHQKVTDNGKY